MSGDVQPRKRKDKKRKRDDDESSHGVHITKMGNEDVHLHVHHEHGTGGHWCAKIFFFGLLAILVGLIALIIMENRGLADLDTPLSKSRFSNYFDGWVEEHRDEHDEHDAVQASIEEHDEHDEPFEEEEDHSEVDDEEHDHDGEEEEDEDEEEEETEETDQHSQAADDRDTAENVTEEDEEVTQEQTKEETEEEEANDEDDDEENVTAEDNDDEDEDEAEEYDDDTQTAEADKTTEDDEDEDKTAEAGSLEQEDNEEEDEESVEPIYTRHSQQTTTSGASAQRSAGQDEDDAFDEEDDDGTFESVEKVVDNDAEELLLLQEKARQQAAEAARNAPPSAEAVDEADDDAEAEAAPSWASSQIKPKQKLGGGPEAADEDDNFDPFEQELRKANEEMMREDYVAASKSFSRLSFNYPHKPQAFLGKAQALDYLAEQKRSNSLLNEALAAYRRYLAFDYASTDDAEYRAAAERCVERIRFMGLHKLALPIQQELITRFSDTVEVRNQLVVTLLMLNRLADAKGVLRDILSRWPHDGFAQVHYGFVLKQHDQDYENAILYLREGIKSGVAGTQDGRFYFNLGDALQRVGRQLEALEVYRRGAELALFPSVYQRSLYNEQGLRAQGFWTAAETGYAQFFSKLAQNWLAIRDEGLSVLSKRGYFQDEVENLRDSGDWKQFELYARGQRKAQNCQKAPITCALVERFSAASGCRRGQIKFSVMHPGTHIWPHCGPTNCRLRAHLGLVVPVGTRLRVAEEERTWAEGEFLIFDDSFEHEVWHNGTGLRLVLIVDVWHPDLSEEQRQSLTPI